MTVHFIGLGGIGMSALARILIQKGVHVQGSDASLSTLLSELKKEGADVQIGHDVKNLKSASTVIVSTGIKEENVELNYAKEKKLKILHRSDLLNELMQGKTKILVSGTHGKTTTSALLAHVLTVASLDPSFIIGGLVRPLNLNGKVGFGEHFVAEADESDGSFLKTNADLAILTSLSDDHLDYWGSSKVLHLAFQQFVHQTKELFWCYDDENLHSLKTKGTSYGFSNQADLQIKNVRPSKHGVLFDLGSYGNIELSLLGEHNVLNASAVFGAALFLGVKEEAIRKALKSFSGVCRRLELKGESHALSVFDDYAHHPKEIKATLKALRSSVCERRLICLFQPHRFSRVQDQMQEFTKCFDAADLVFVTDIYSAGEKPIDGISNKSFFSHLKQHLGEKIHFLSRESLEKEVGAACQPHDVVITMGAGDITNAGIPILHHYTERAPKLKIGVLFGGTSLEHAVSMMSAKKISEALDRSLYNVSIFGITTDGHWTKGFDLKKVSQEKLPHQILEQLSTCDVCIPVFHGPQGEDGMIGAVLDALHIPYAGCDYRSGVVSMQKIWSKQIVSHANIPVGPYLELKKCNFEKSDIDRIEEMLPYPVWVKPAHLGSSIAVHRAKNREELIKFIDLAFLYDHVLILEKEIVGRQIEFGLIGNEYIQKAVPSEIVNNGAFISYDKKYGEDAMEVRAPAEISDNQKEIGYELAERVFRTLGCKGLARVDFFLDENGYYWFNEINPFPGFTETSAFPIMWAATGKDRKTINDEIIVLALQKQRRLNEVCRMRGK